MFEVSGTLFEDLAACVMGLGNLHVRSLLGGVLAFGYCGCTFMVWCL